MKVKSYLFLANCIRNLPTVPDRDLGSEDPPDLKIALGSCAFINEEKYDRPGDPYGGNYEIFEI